MSDVPSGVDRGVSSDVLPTVPVTTTTAEPTTTPVVESTPVVETAADRKARILAELEQLEADEAAEATNAPAEPATEDEKVLDLLGRLRHSGTADEISTVKEWLTDHFGVKEDPTEAS